MKKFAGNYPLVMRGFLGFVLLWFGINEILEPAYWSGYVPPFAVQFLPFSVNLFVQLHGVVLTFLAISLFFRFYLYYTAFLTILVLLSIIGGLIVINGFNEIVVRDIGLLGLALAIWLYEVAQKKKVA